MTNEQEQIHNQEQTISTTKNRIMNIKTLLVNALARIEQRSLNPSGISGIPTGYGYLDRILTGLNAGELIVLAARPAMGKTAFSLNIACNVARLEKTAVIFNLETTGIQLADRLLGLVGNIDSQAIRTGRMSQRDWDNLEIAMHFLHEAPLEIIDDAFTLKQIESDAYRLKRELGEIGVIVIDYLQLISIEENFGTQYERISHISRSLKLLARKLNVPIIAVSELSRAVEQRQDKRPMLFDLRDSGCLEEDADSVIFLYRDDYYNEESEKKNIAEVIVGKQRNGPVGKVELIYLKNFHKFIDFIK